MEQRKILCPCGSEKLYKECCKDFHEEKKFPKHAIELMRSRYSAYALNLPEYIIKTTHSKNPTYQENKRAWREAITHFCIHTEFIKLEILSSYETKNQAIVIFIAHLVQNHTIVTFTEKSIFEKVNDHWSYLQGEVFPGIIDVSFFERSSHRSRVN